MTTRTPIFQTTPYHVNKLPPPNSTVRPPTSRPAILPTTPRFTPPCNAISRAGTCCVAVWPRPQAKFLAVNCAEAQRARAGFQAHKTVAQQLGSESVLDSLGDNVGAAGLPRAGLLSLGHADRWCESHIRRDQCRQLRRRSAHAGWQTSR